VGEPVDTAPHGSDELEPGHHRGRALLLGEHGRRLDRQGERVVRAVVRHVAVGRLGGQPLLDVPADDAGALGEVGDGGRPDGGQRSPEADPVAEIDQDGVVRRGLVGSHLAGELLELGDVEGGCVELGSHDVVLSLGARIGAVDVQRARHDWQRTVAAMTGS
jgi:hypothetical protein